MRTRHAQWTAVTIDGKPSAQFEETLLITETGVEVLTAAPGWTLPEPKGAAAPASAPAQGQGVQTGAEGKAGEKREGEAAPKKKKKAKKAGAAPAAEPAPAAGSAAPAE